MLFKCEVTYHNTSGSVRYDGDSNSFYWKHFTRKYLYEPIFLDSLSFQRGLYHTYRLVPNLVDCRIRIFEFEGG